MINLSKDEAKAVLEFLKRSNLSGAEVPVYNILESKLKQGIAATDMKTNENKGENLNENKNV